MGDDARNADKKEKPVDTLDPCNDKKKEDIVGDALGDFGWWQARVCICLSLLKLPVAWHQLSIVFLAPPPGDFYCADGINDNNTHFPSNASLSQIDKCHWHKMGVEDGAENSTTQAPCQKWIYDHSIFEETIISEWDLVCHRSQSANIAQTSFMLGILLGNFLFGMISDRFGRKKPLLAAIVLQMVAGIGTAYIPWFEGFLLLRFLLAFATGGTMMTSFVICMEVVGGWWRTAAPILYHLPFSIGHSSLAAFSYKFRHWRHFQLAISLPSILLLSYWWLIPESPRWLLAMGHHKEAKKLLTAAAATNGRKWNSSTLSNLEEKYSKKREKENKCIEKGEMHSKEIKSAKEVHEIINKEQDEKQSGGNVLHLFKTPNLRRKTLVIMYNWLVCGLGFFGIAQYMGRLAGNIFINVAISGAIQIPGTIGCMYAMFHLGRRITLTSSQFLAGISCLLITCAPLGMEWLVVAFSAAGLIGMSSAFPTNYLYSAELFPTVVRNAGVGAASMCARIGSLIAPFITTLDVFSPIIPPIIYGIFPLLAGILALLLPETINQHLPDTIEEGEEFGKKHKNGASITPAEKIENDGLQ
ncbi:organic cation transporter protein-like [Ischnura elegans]|uniref:organic cation transporter protein-like n=1 Tax=Ischnura elegans TaxID=197161 RepID=UPI001ED89E1F|nr:organic cation transporter protein-like [Ischnura elegans]